MVIKIEGKEVELTSEQKRFCELYVSNEFFANGVRSYSEAYNIDLKDSESYNVCKSAASRLLTSVNLLAYINHLLELSGLNDSFVDKQLAFLITQNGDFGTKLAAIREYNKLKSRIVNRTELSGSLTLEAVMNMSAEERRNKISQIKSQLKQ